MGIATFLLVVTLISLTSVNEAFTIGRAESVDTNSVNEPQGREKRALLDLSPLIGVISEPTTEPPSEIRAIAAPATTPPPVPAAGGGATDGVTNMGSGAVSEGAGVANNALKTGSPTTLVMPAALLAPMAAGAVPSAAVPAVPAV